MPCSRVRSLTSRAGLELSCHHTQAMTSVQRHGLRVREAGRSSGRSLVTPPQRLRPWHAARSAHRARRQRRCGKRRSRRREESICCGTADRPASTTSLHARQALPGICDRMTPSHSMCGDGNAGAATQCSGPLHATIDQPQHAVWSSRPATVDPQGCASRHRRICCRAPASRAGCRRHTSAEAVWTPA